MTLSIIIIGDEILLGQVADTNSRYISRLLGASGWQTRRVLTVGDDAAQIRRAVEMCMADCDLTITTGGLGPTKDDITKTTLAQLFDAKLVFDPDVERNVLEIFARRGLQINHLTRMQAMVPDKCRVINNRFGTAPLMWFERRDDAGRLKALLSMPGVPFETEGMLQAEAGEMIGRSFAPDKVFFHNTMLVSGISESALAEKLAGYEESLPAGFHLAYLPAAGILRLRLDGVCDISDARNVKDIDRNLLDKLKSLLGNLLLADMDIPLHELLIDILRRKGLTMSTAESCTGGNIAHVITSVSGCSDVFRGSVVSYANEVKSNVLNVDAAVIRSRGAVSQEVVEAMARNVCGVCGSDCSVATSGIAGPGGGSEDKPVGTVWIAACVRGHVISKLCHLPGNRQRVIERATNEALAMLVATLRTDC